MTSHRMLRRTRTAPAGHRVRVVSNVPGLADAAVGQFDHRTIVVSRYLMPRLKQIFLVAARSYRSDVVFLNCAVTEALALCVCLIFMPFNRCRVIVADPVLRVPTTRRHRLTTWLKRQVFRRVDVFILYQKDFAGYMRWYGIDASRVVYIPFKVNSLDLITRLVPVDGDYALATGVSLRDWTTLAAAIRGLDIRLVISVPASAADGEMPRPSDFGSQVTLLKDEGPVGAWLQRMALAKFVILPISSDSIAPSGISTYLCAMALRKCVILTAGPSTHGLLNETMSVLVPPADVRALREAIERVNSDAAFRRDVADAGFRYAMSCGDERRLYSDFVTIILAVADSSRSGRRPPHA